MGLFSSGLGFRMLPWFSADMELSDTPPSSEAVTPAAGSGSKVSRDDHAHQRLTSAHSGLILDGGGTLQVTFTRTFVTKPAISMIPVQTSPTQPLVLTVTGYVMANGLYTGVNIKGFMGQVVTVALLGVNVNALGGNAAGQEFTLIALQVS